MTLNFEAFAYSRGVLAPHWLGWWRGLSICANRVFRGTMGYRESQVCKQIKEDAKRQSTWLKVRDDLSIWKMSTEDFEAAAITVGKEGKT